ncbi:MAG: hypothetical protein ACR2GB_00560 [Nocardioidaceae bacterium]
MRLTRDETGARGGGIEPTARDLSVIARRLAVVGDNGLEVVTGTDDVAGSDHQLMCGLALEASQSVVDLDPADSEPQQVEVNSGQPLRGH